MHKWSFASIFLIRFQIADLLPFIWPESLKITVFMICSFMSLQFLAMDPRKLCHCADITVGQETKSITYSIDRLFKCVVTKYNVHKYSPSCYTVI
jgi:hypothetical protein